MAKYKLALQSLLRKIRLQRIQELYYSTARFKIAHLEHQVCTQTATIAHHSQSIASEQMCPLLIQIELY